MSANDEDRRAAGHESLLTLASLDLIAEQIHQPIFAKNKQLQLVLLNSAYADLVCRPREELLGRTETELFGREVSAARETQERQVLEGQHPLTGREQFVNEDGQSHERSVTKLPLTDADGTPTHIVGVIAEAGGRPATREQLVEELERYAQERTRALRSVHDQRLRKERLMILGQLAAGLAHQIRNPLGAIANALALARRQMPRTAPPPVHQALEIANDEIWEANRIIADLLDYARIRPPLRKEAQISELVRTALEAERLPTSINVKLTFSTINVWVDEDQVRDALRNLVRNAREAMNNGGTLSISSELANDELLLRVRDTGGGVPPENQPLLFEPLVSSKPLGMGLGLATARSLIANQGGSLEYDMDNVDGACFVVRMPLSPPASEETDAD